jgi:hypothetical protein
VSEHVPATPSALTREWLLAMLATADKFSPDGGTTTVTADYWTGGTVFYISRPNEQGESTRLSRQGQWLVAYLSDDPVAFNDATAFPDLAQALAVFMTSSETGCRE